MSDIQMYFSASITKPIFMKTIELLLFLSICFLISSCQRQKASKTPKQRIEVENPVSISRSHETIVLSAELLGKLFPGTKVEAIQLKSLLNDSLLTTQAIDNTEDGIADEFIFQSDFKPNEKRSFEIEVFTEKPIATPKVFAAFMSLEKGMGDFTWENDLIGYRYYGQERAEKQGTGIAMDIWCKRRAEFLSNRWYTSSHSYHEDTGYGADHYNSGKNSGCGGTGLYSGDSIYYPEPYSSWRLIENGPIRVVFELRFTGWSLDPELIETKRITLDAGHHLNRVESSYSKAIDALGYTHTIGFVQRDDSSVDIGDEKRWMACWESLGETKGNLGTGFIALAGDVVDLRKIDDHMVCMMRAHNNEGLSYYAGAAWDVFGSIHSQNDWKLYIDHKMQCIKNPCIVRIQTGE